MQIESGPILDAWGLKRSFGLTVAVGDLDISVQSGELVAVVGPKGCGKSTLLALLSGHLDCEEGQVLFHGKEVTHLSSLQRAKLGLMRVFDEGALFDELTIADHILAIARNTEPTTSELYAQWQVDSRFLKLGIRVLGAAGLDIPAATSVGALTVLQKKQLALGLTALVPYDLLLWDDPFDGIGDEHHSGLVDLLQGPKAANKAILFTAADAAAAAEVADRVLMMSEGGIATPS